MVKDPTLDVPGIFSQLCHFPGYDVEPVGIKHFGVALVQPDDQLIRKVVKVINNLCAYLREIGETLQVRPINVHAIQFKILIATGIFEVHDACRVFPEICGNVPILLRCKLNGLLLSDLLDKNIHPFFNRGHVGKVLPVRGDLIARLFRVFKKIF